MWWQSAAAVCRFELGIQRREPATALYALVFFLLTFAFVSSGTVELIRDRGALPKLSPLAISLALGGLTAFGQVITTMITASAMLRDRAWRTDQLLFTTPLSHSAWVVGRWFAALLTMCVVYGALMFGVLAGAWVLYLVHGSLSDSASAATAHAVSAADVMLRTMWAWMTLTVPTTIAVATILVTAAVRTRHLLGVLSAALALLFLWQACEAVLRNAPDISGNIPLLASLADPFGTTALQVVTASWSDTERATRLVPFMGLVGASRMLWLVLAFGIGTIALRPVRHNTRGNVSASAKTARTGRFSGRVRGTLRNSVCNTVSSRVNNSVRSLMRWIDTHPFLALMHFSLRWTWRERGWLVIAALGMVNVGAHAFTAAPSMVASASGIIVLVAEHARLFFILLATIYAGEILWRDVDERVVELVNCSPVGSAQLVLSRVFGVMSAQLALVLALVGVAWALATLRYGMVSLPRVFAYAALWLFVPFALWLVLSLAVHVLVGNKIVAHLALIAGWVLAVAVDANGWAQSPWIRYADLAPLGADGAAPFALALQQTAWWCTVSALLLVFTVHRWRSVTSRR